MFAAMLLAISIVALSQFALYYWRAVLAGVAAQPVSDRVLGAAHLEAGRMKGQDFETLAGLHELTPDLRTNGGGLTLVRAYYKTIEGLNDFVWSPVACGGGMVRARARDLRTVRRGANWACDCKQISNWLPHCAPANPLSIASRKLTANSADFARGPPFSAAISIVSA